MTSASAPRAVRRGLAAAMIPALIGAWSAMSDRSWAQAAPPPAVSLDRAQALIQARAYDRAARELREILSADPRNRGARELLAFALESSGDLDGERRVRSALAAEFPRDARVQADYGRVLERSGDQRGALAAYRLARELSPDAPDPELEAGIERMKGRTSVEVAAPVGALSDPDATARTAGVGAAVPFGSLHHLALRTQRLSAERRSGPGATTADLLALSLVLRNRPGASLMMKALLHEVSREDDERPDRRAGGELVGRGPIGRRLEGEAGGEIEAPWNESAVTMLHGGRSTGGRARLYAHFLDRRLILQVGAQERRLSILAADPNSMDRPEARQSLLVGGADVVLWRKPGSAMRGEILDEGLAAPAALASSITLGYRHYEASNHATQEFAALLGLVPRGSVDEVSTNLAAVSPRGRFGLDLRAGLGRDAARETVLWRAGGELIWAPKAGVRVGLGYEEATEVATGLVGRRDAGWLSVHVDL